MDCFTIFEGVGGFGFDLDMTLFKNIDGFDVEILDTPMGMGMYDINSGKFKFDLDHTDRMKLRIENELNRLRSIDENRANNKRAFDVAMKAGENAMKKKEWQEALAHFDEALSLIPDEEEAIAERDKAREKLDALAAELAEDIDAQESARAAEEAAAAEALAKENAERIADEEDARKRQEEADARRAAADAAASTDDTQNQVVELPEQVSDDSSSDDTDSSAASAASAADAEDSAARDSALRDREQNAENRALEEQMRRESEEEERRGQLEESESQDRAEADQKQANEEADAKRAALLAKNSSNKPDEAEKYFKEALKSESIAKAEELAARVKAENDALRAREEESRERQWLEQEELEVLIQNSKISDAESRSNAQAIMNRRNELFSVVKNYDHSVSQEVGEMYEGDAMSHKRKVQDVEAQIHDDSDRYQGDLDQRRVDSESGNYNTVAKLYNLSDGTSRTNGVPYLSMRDVDLPQGLYESSYKIQNGIVIERTLRTGNKVIHYRKVMMKTGTYYFRDGVSITSAVWRLETTVVHD